MATQPVTNSQPQPEFTTVFKEVAYGHKTLDDGKKELVVLDTTEAEKLASEGKFSGQVVKTKLDLPVNWPAVMSYASKTYTDDEGNSRDINEVLTDLVTLMRVGFTTKATNRRNQSLLATDKDGNITFSDKDLTDGVFDLTPYITSESKRKFKTEEQRTWDSISGLAPAVRDNMWKVYLTSIGKEFYIPNEASAEAK